MQIVRLELENVKSYAQLAVSFSAGTNAICGHNGAGKSTLLEAIGFALFDFLAVNQTDFVREGEKTATVTVSVLGIDERIYQVVRRCGGSNQYYIYDPELRQKLTEGKEETLTWLRDFLGVDEMTNLASLFRDAVGVPQGLLTAAFLESPTNRRNIFNPLLQVDEYERAWGALREPRSRLEEQIHAAEKSIAGLEAEVRLLPEREARATELSAGIAEAEGRQAEFTAELERVAQQAAALELQRRRLVELEQAAAQAVREAETAAGRRAEALAALQRAEAARAVVAESTAGEQAYQAAQVEQEALDLRRREREKLLNEQQKLEKEAVKTQTNLAAVEAEWAEILQAEAAVETLRPQAEAQACLETALVGARRDVDRLAAAQTAVTQERQRRDALRATRERLQAGAAERAGLESQKAVREAALAPLLARRETLAAAQVERQAEVRTLTGLAQQAAQRCAQLEQELVRERAQQQELDSRAAAVRRGLAERETVEVDLARLRQEIEALDAEIAGQVARAAEAQAGLTHLETQRAALLAVETAQCPVCEAPLTPEHRAELLERQQSRHAEAGAALVTAQAQQKQLEKERRGLMKKVQAAEAALGTLPRPAEAEDLAARLAGQAQRILEGTGQLARETAESTALLGRRQAAEAALNEIQPQLADLEAERGSMQQELAGIEKRLAALPREAEVEAAAAQLQHQEAALVDAERTAAALVGAPESAAQLERELEALGNPRLAYQRAADTAGRREAAAKRRAELHSRQAELEQRQAASSAALAAYDTLDAQLVEVRAALKIHEPAHRRYLEHWREAESWPERQSALAAAEAGVTSAESRRAVRLAERDQAAAAYDAPGHEALRVRWGQLREQLAGLAARLTEQRAQFQALQQELARLAESAAALAAAKTGHAELQTLLALLENFRQTLRDAGPQITKELVALISAQADRFYAELMQDFNTRLRWTETYDIVLSTGGRERTFQQLSGGEQMSAALAVRLALLREISTIDVAFLDEPTAHLDPQRRDNLAEQILAVKGFSQLFVISHDDTFERETEHVVRLVKQQGATQMEN